jgi:hypothetical protein
VVAHGLQAPLPLPPRVAVYGKGKLVDIKQLFFLFLFMLLMNLNVICKTK